MKMLMKGNSLGKKREGFTLIELLIVMVILAILAGIVIISIGGVIGRGQATAYNADREQIQAAVSEFMTRPTDANYGHVIGQVPLIEPNMTAATPLVGGTDIIGEGVLTNQEYHLIAMCPLTVNAFPKGILKQVPATAHSVNLADAGANSYVGYADADCVGTLQEECGHYAWFTTLGGDIISMCMGDDCTNGPDAANTSVMDGFQDVYP